MSGIDGVNETKYKGYTIKTTENNNGMWSWKIDGNYRLPSIYPDKGESYSEHSALTEAKEKIDEAVKDAM